MKNFEDILNQVGSFGRYQKMVYLLVFIAGIPNSFTTLHFIFSNHTPDFRCRFPSIVQDLMTENRSSLEFLLNLTIPMEEDQFGVLRRSQCSMYRRNYTEILASNFTLDLNDSDTTYCMNGYEYDYKSYQSSAVTDFNMVCQNSWKSPVTISMFSVGCAFGSTMGFLSDRFGRRPVFLIATWLQLVIFAATALSWDFVSYSVFTVLTGVPGLVNFVVAFILATEITGAEKRNFIAMSSFFSYAIGYIMLPGIAYLAQTWRWFLVVMSVISAVLQIVHFWFFPESARWLIVSGRIEQAKKEVKRIARMNGRKVDVDEMFRNMVEETGKLLSDEAKSNHEKCNIVTLLKDSLTRGRFFSIYYAWFVTSSIYYAVTWFSTDFSENLFLNCLYPGIIEFFTYIGSFFLVKIIGRPRSITLCVLVFSLTYLLLLLVSRDLLTVRSVVAFLGKSAVSGLFYMVYITSGELPPTRERNTSVGIASACARIGGFTAPYLMYLGEYNYAIPYLVMMFFALSCGFSTYISIPETKGVEMPDSLEDVKQNRRFYGWKFWLSRNGNVGKVTSRMAEGARSKHAKNQDKLTV